jgi:RNA polymerase sigma-70 factor (ECF subfamily)
MARLRAGQNDAATQVFDRFAGHLIALARKHLDAQVLQKVDPEDVLQSVFRSFFARYPSGQLGSFASWDNLWAMLVVITLRKCGRQMDYFHAACRDVRREVAGPADPDGSALAGGADEPTPSEAAMLTETVERLMGCLDGRHRDILALRLQGHPPPEISSRLGCTERTVYRVLERVKQWLEAVGSEPGEGQDRLGRPGNPARGGAGPVGPRREGN